MGHKQPATPIQTDNITAHGILNGTIEQKRSKCIDMKFYWLKDRVEQKQIAVNLAPGIKKLGDYSIKHHVGIHHRKVCPIYLYVKDKNPSTMQKYVKILKDDRSPYAQANARSTRSTA